MPAVYTFDEDCISDLHKDAMGFRPASYWFAAWNAMSDAEKQAEWDSLVAAMARREEQRIEDEQASVVKFEKNVASVISSGAEDRATAIRWMMDGAGIENRDVEYFEYCNGIPYGYVAKSNLPN